MTKRRDEQRKRQRSKVNQADRHDKQRDEKAEAEYKGSIQESLDGTNQRIRGVDGEDAAPPPGGPDYKKKTRQKNRGL
jgi:hypothetical protein